MIFFWLLDVQREMWWQLATFCEYEYACVHPNLSVCGLFLLLLCVYFVCWPGLAAIITATVIWCDKAIYDEPHKKTRIKNHFTSSSFHFLPLIIFSTQIDNKKWLDRITSQTQSPVGKKICASVYDKVISLFFAHYCHYKFDYAHNLLWWEIKERDKLIWSVVWLVCSVFSMNIKWNKYIKKAK